MNRIIQLIFAFNGDIYGDAVFRQLGGPSLGDVTLYNNNNNDKLFVQTTIQCRIDPHLVRTFIDVLKLDFKCTTETHTDNKTSNPALHLVFLTAMCFNAYVSIIACTTKLWIQMSCDFDVNILSQNKAALYMRLSNGKIDRCPVPNMNVFISRVMTGKFALWPVNTCLDDAKDWPSGSKQALLMSKALCMINEGWCMDDAMMGLGSWVMALWKHWVNHYERIRIYNNGSQDHQKYHDHKSLTMGQTECPICKEDFKDDDVVVNLRCGHNFHVQCSRYTQQCEHVKQQGGLELWLKNALLHDGTCPMCRCSIP